MQDCASGPVNVIVCRALDVYSAHRVCTRLCMMKLSKVISVRPSTPAPLTRIRLHPALRASWTAVYDRYNGLNIAAERQRNGGAVTTRLCQENNKGM